MLFIIGMFLILLGVILDEGTTLLVCLRGYCTFEANPIALRIGILATYLLFFIIYLSLILFWRWLLLRHKTLIRKRINSHKFFDILIFLMCFLIIFMSFTKLEMGFNNIKVIKYSFTEKEYMQKQLTEMEDLKSTNEPAFIEERQDQYINQIITGINYYKMVIIFLFSYLLFRLGYRVEPYEYL